MVGRNLMRLRQRAGLTQDALAERLHVTRQAVSSWETGKTAPDVETLTTLAAALKVDVRALIYGPEAVEGGYARFQRRYVVSTAVLGTLVLLWLAVGPRCSMGSWWCRWDMLLWVYCCPCCCRCGSISGCEASGAGGSCWYWDCWL